MEGVGSGMEGADRRFESLGGDSLRGAGDGANKLSAGINSIKPPRDMKIETPD
jgi:hypothetical protein